MALKPFVFKSELIDMNRTLYLLLFFVGLLTAIPAQAQFYLNQGQLAELMHECTPELERLPKVNYDYKVLYSSRNNSVLARSTFYKVIGEGDVKKGYDRALLVALLNRKLMDQMNVGDTLIVPDKWDLDFCAYSPFPRFYAGGLSFDKLFIIDKSIQAWAAYESGRLARWGIVNTGDAKHRTPNGRFNFNWKAEYRVSSHSPPGEPWEMYWLFNFVEERGIHVHQYPFPSGGPMSHGCVRLVDEDAIWIYNWADGWQKGANGFKSSMGSIAKPGTTVLVIGNDPPGNPTTFSSAGRTPELMPVNLPGHPFDVPPGGPQQQHFDRIRKM
ncbi:MAG: L,D-transpeptidase [Bacteroidetes bacterium]|nr:L,D-transpeptidase [Bacteroidota bacterium]